MKEINFKDKNIYKNIYDEREYLPYSKSVLDVEWVKNRMVFTQKAL